MTTTIKVSNELRDRLKGQAARAGLTLGGHLAALADRADRDESMANLAAAIAATPPEVMEEYARETAIWERVEAEDLDGGSR
ncbi:DNA mismatch repair protein MutS [Serinibacter salmoneus]|uniref:Uncharacterized protein n=1 Tax=Serinibacter salmoneus TaxID=556530 RepID=A0A2A9D0E2_9MICO|nr:DNA mismatch repair protein MutS [Serinibacter salmoneus]PFG20168.1 hypothetical protein ATL40_1755 [Serinibacter salmoneus]